MCRVALRARLQTSTRERASTCWLAVEPWSCRAAPPLLSPGLRHALEQRSNGCSEWLRDGSSFCACAYVCVYIVKRSGDRIASQPDAVKESSRSGRRQRGCVWAGNGVSCGWGRPARAIVLVLLPERRNKNGASDAAF